MISLSEVTRNLKSENQNRQYLKNDGYDTLPLFVEEIESGLGSLQEVAKKIEISVDDLQIENSIENENILIELRTLNDTSRKILDLLKPDLDDLEARREAAKQSTTVGRAPVTTAGLFPNAVGIGGNTNTGGGGLGGLLSGLIGGAGLRGLGRGAGLRGLFGRGGGLLRLGRASAIGLVGAIASQMLGGFISEVTGMPGLGSMVGAIGTGASMGAMFGPVGAVFGGIAGAIIEGGNQLAAAVERARIEMEATADELIARGRELNDENLIAQGVSILSEQAAPGAATPGERAAAAQQILDRVTDTELQNPRIRAALAEQTLAVNLAEATGTAWSENADEAETSFEEALREFVRDIYDLPDLPERLREGLDPSRREEIIIQRAQDTGILSGFVDPDQAIQIIQDEIESQRIQAANRRRTEIDQRLTEIQDPDTLLPLPGFEEENNRLIQELQNLPAWGSPNSVEMRTIGDQSSLQAPVSLREAMAGLIRSSYGNTAPVIINAPNNSSTTVASNSTNGGGESGMISTVDGRFSYMI